MRERPGFGFTLGSKHIEKEGGEKEGKRDRRRGRRKRRGREQPHSFVIHCDGNVLLKYTSDLGRLVFHIHYTGVKSNFVLLCLVHWSIVHMTFCNMLQHKAINHTESE